MQLAWALLRACLVEIHHEGSVLIKCSAGLPKILLGLAEEREREREKEKERERERE